MASQHRSFPRSAWRFGLLLLAAEFGALSAPVGAALPAATIVDGPAPFKAARCDVQQDPNGVLGVFVTFENRDTVRTALQVEETVTLQDARRNATYSAIVPKGPYGPAGSATSVSPLPVIRWAHTMPPNFDWGGVHAISCTQYAALFDDGHVWLHLDAPATAADGASCAQLFVRNRFAEAETRCVSSFNAALPAARRAEAPDRHLADAETAVRDALTPSRAAARLGKPDDTALLLNAIDAVANTPALERAALLVPPLCRGKLVQFDACVRGEQQRARTFYQTASRDQRRIFMLQAMGPDDYRGLPCAVRPAQPIEGRQVWFYCDRKTLRPVRGYLFVDGKLRSIFDPQRPGNSVTS